jgi:hypothetical protein
MAQIFTLQPQYEYITELNWKTQQTPFDLGVVQTRAYWPFPKRLWHLNWSVLKTSEADYVESFFREHVGPAGTFDFIPNAPIAPPHRAGDPTQIAGGSLSFRTYYFSLTWLTSSGETILGGEQSFSISANNLFKITIPKFFYRSITSAKLYAGIDSNSKTLQTSFTVPGSSFTEPVTGLVTGASPPSTNTAKETVSVHLFEDAMPIPQVNSGIFTLALQFEEIL